jgi:hypothetical protein
LNQQKNDAKPQANAQKKRYAIKSLSWLLVNRETIVEKAIMIDEI